MKDLFFLAGMPCVAWLRRRGVFYVFMLWIVGEAELDVAVGDEAEGGEVDGAHELGEELGVEGRLEGVRDLVEPQVARRKGRRAGVEVLELGVVWQPHGQHQRPIQRVRLRESAPRRAA